MTEKQEKNLNILITGGTSGLGLELVRLFLQEGYNVVATGRQRIILPGFEERFTLYNVDFADLKQVAAVANQICNNHSFSFIVNNAGILSPPEYTQTIDGLEYTFQINFLAHLLINNIILNGIDDERQARIVSVTSPVYRFAAHGTGLRTGSDDYRPMRSYSASKLYAAMMCEFLCSRHEDQNLQCFSFDPGTFSSGIYRMQKGWFKVMYRIAAPFMRSPRRVARALKELMQDDNILNGMVYDSLKRRSSLPKMDKNITDAIINYCYELIDPFLN